MLIDDNLVSIDGESLSGTITGEAIPLTSFLKPGRMAGPVYTFVAVQGEAAGGTSITLTVEEGDSEDGDFTEVDGSSLTVALEDMTEGKNIGWRFLPVQVEKQWIRIVSTPTGTFTDGSLFAAVVREDPFQYEDGMYMDKGTVLG